MELGQLSPASPVNDAASAESLRPAAPANLCTVMCIEDRHKQQDILREYFSKHGFRVLVLSDLQRGLNRLRSSPPDCMVIMGDALGDRALQGFQEAQEVQRNSDIGLVLVLAEQQSEWKSRLAENRHCRVLVQPVTLRELRKVVRNTVCGNNDVPGGAESENGEAYG